MSDYRAGAGSRTSPEWPTQGHAQEEWGEGSRRGSAGPLGQFENQNNNTVSKNELTIKLSTSRWTHTPLHTHVGEKDRLCLKHNTELQLAAGERELFENHHCATTVVKTGPGENYEWLLNWGEVWMKSTMFAWSKSTFSKLLIIYKGKNWNCTAEKQNNTDWLTTLASPVTSMCVCTSVCDTLRRTLSRM